ncbi:SMI1/KNR4 family protein [Alkalihalobacillus trypoxylicola]|uniref:Knr4/Smi1-like domain-containing protein n=1 Tax=Alkalihalobacillus trypoxylicola TaxID=519424 RepID=A0A162EP36_9BACI|nr:SMI1/KNR4 family protein [Alkalihalobacillus trypoxylicola]KYG33387.1 hypothetical protein AZF04_16875 [Alkalihalobacillus trypoxylicola]
MHDIWKNELLDEYELEPLTDRVIAFAEAQLGVKLPPSLIELLQIQNGGYLQANRYPYVDEEEMEEETDEEEDEENPHLILDHIYGISTNEDEGLLQTNYLVNEWELPKNIVIIHQDGHRFIALDYRTVKNNPPVIIIDEDIDVVDQLAVDFSELLQNLYSEEDEGSEEERKDYNQLFYLYGQKPRDYSYKEAERIFKGKSIGDVEMALHYFYHKNDNTEWLISQISYLLNSTLDFAPETTIETFHDYLKAINFQNESNEKKQRIEQIINTFKSSTNRKIQRFANKLEQYVETNQ